MLSLLVIEHRSQVRCHHNDPSLVLRIGIHGKQVALRVQSDEFHLTKWLRVVRLVAILALRVAQLAMVAIVDRIARLSHIVEPLDRVRDEQLDFLGLALLFGHHSELNLRVFAQITQPLDRLEGRRLDRREARDDVGNEEKFLLLGPEDECVVRVFQLCLNDEVCVLGVLFLDLEDNLIFEFLLDNVNNEQTTVICHQAEILL